MLYSFNNLMQILFKMMVFLKIYFSIENLNFRFSVFMLWHLALDFMKFFVLFSVMEFFEWNIVHFNE